MRILMVTPYPPTRDGIAAYAVQSVRALRAAGHHVEVLSPGPSAAHHHLDLVGPRGALALARRVRAYDKVVVQFHPDFFYPRDATRQERALESVALAVAVRRARRVEVVVHEIDGRHGRRHTPDGLAARRLWRSVDRVFVHTEREREDFARDFGVPVRRIEVTDHGAHFVPRTHHDRASARTSLAVPQDAFMFLSIGFIQPHKGFDRAVQAFAGLGMPDARLDIVGSVRVEEPEFVAYREGLAALVESTAGAHLHDGFVSDELFDRWIVAADVVVLPYRSIWSSGVLERARLFGRPVIATAVGGLPHQAAALFGADADLDPAPAPEPEPVATPATTVHFAQSARSGISVGSVETLKSVETAGSTHTARSAESSLVPSVAPRAAPGGAPRCAAVPVRLVADDSGLRLAMRAAASGDTEAPIVPDPWPAGADDLRATVQNEVVARAAASRGSPLPDIQAGNGDTGRVAAASTVSAPLRRVRNLELPSPTSRRPAARLAKRAVRRLTAWEVEPVVRQLNMVHTATVEAVEAAEAAAARAADHRRARHDGDGSV